MRFKSRDPGPKANRLLNTVKRSVSKTRGSSQKQDDILACMVKPRGLQRTFYTSPILSTCGTTVAQIKNCAKTEKERRNEKFNF